jgi:phenylacetate-CoA ligase
MRRAILLHTLRALRSQWWDEGRIATWQEQALIASMRYACARVPFYRALGIDPESITSAADLQRFPVVRKRDLQSAPRSFIADGFDTAKLHSSRTSGSTGEPTVTFFDEDTWALCKYALKIRRIAAATSPLFRRCLIISDEHVESYRRQRPFGGGFLYAERLMSLYDDLPAHRRTIAEFRPDMVNGFPSYFLELAHSYRATGETPPRIPFLFTSSEVLTPPARELIEATFRGRVHDVYGCTEFKEIAWECPHGGMHLNFESAHVETSEGILVSTLRNRAMPLLRYRTGDAGSLEAAGCACGRHSPKLRISMGRLADVVQLPSGRRISPFTLTTPIGALPGLFQYRIVHEAPARFVIEMVTSPPVPSERVAECRQRVLESLAEPVEVSFVQVERFERQGGGKHKIYVRRW